MGDWWFVVFWLLLIPLIIVEIIIFLKSRKFFWLTYALAIFTYIVAVSYTIDVFDLGKNAVILTLLASAVLMFFLGRQMGKKVKKQKQLPKLERNIVIGLATVMALLFIVSVIFGKASESVSPVDSIKASDIVKTYEDQKGYEPRNEPVTILHRTVSNSFILPVPLTQHNYYACLVAKQGLFDLYPSYTYDGQNNEVAPGAVRTADLTVQPYYGPAGQRIDATELRIYENENGQYSYASCASISAKPQFVIPIQ